MSPIPAEALAAAICDAMHDRHDPDGIVGAAELCYSAQRKAEPILAALAAAGFAIVPADREGEAVTLLRRILDTFDHPERYVQPIEVEQVRAYLVRLPEEERPVSGWHGKPNPGSDEARKQGCACAVMDNNHGKRAPWPPDGWWVTGGCPVHAPRTLPDAAAEGER